MKPLLTCSSPRNSLAVNVEVLFTTEEQFASTIHWPNEDLFSDKVTDSNNFIRFLKYYKQGGDLVYYL